MRHRMLGFTAIAVSILLLLLLSGPARADTITPTDFVFIIDSTGSMAGEISAVKSGLSDFIDGLDTASIDSRFAVVLFGGAPELVLDWTTSKTAVINAFNSISVSGAVSGFQNNHNVNPEAGLEAIRIVLGEAVDSTLLGPNVGGNLSDGLDFRTGARKNLILLTDEDSDLPYYSDNRVSGQSTLDPPTTTTTLASAWQTEVDNTAAAVISNAAFVNMLINTGDNPTKWQYGDWAQDDADSDFLNFDPAQTLANLVAAGYGDSLEAQILAAGLIGRTFNIGDVDTANFVDNFFAAKIEETLKNPIVPLPAAAWMGMAMLGGLGVIRRIRRRRA